MAFQIGQPYESLAVFAAVTLAGIVFFYLLHLVAKKFSKQSRSFHSTYEIIRPRFFTLGAIIVVWIGLYISPVSKMAFWSFVSHAIFVLLMLCMLWLLIGALRGLFDFAIDRFSTETSFSRQRRTQLLLLKRLSIAILITIVIASILFSFTAVRVLGVSLFASAGIISVIAGLAAQSLFGNLIAGLQLTFSNALRVGDTVVVEGEYGSIGEINLAYVVVNIWDERKLIVPCTYFTKQPFELWTRYSDQITGTIFMDLDWRISITELRSKFFQILEASAEHDGRVGSCYVTDLTNNFVRVRFAVSTASPGDLWTLTYRIREEILLWLQTKHPEALPTTRITMT